MADKIVVRGARVHNLKNITVEIPRDKLTVLTGISGSGKSSLAFDTIYAEGQRRYVESLSAYARQFLGLMDKPDVDSIEGLSPSISIDQKTASHNPRSTVGTVTEIYDYLRLLYARTGRPHCYECGREVQRQTTDQIADQVLHSVAGSLKEEGAKIMLLAPMIKDKKGEHKSALFEIRKAGFSRVRLDGVFMTVEEALAARLAPKKQHTIDVAVDRFSFKKGQNAEERADMKARIADSLETALDFGDGMVIVHDPQSGEDRMMSTHFACTQCKVNLTDLEPRNFSFNSPHGACPTCSGLGMRMEVDLDLLIPNKRLSIAEGAIRPWSRSMMSGWYARILTAASKKYGFPMNKPIARFTKEQMEVMLYGNKSETLLVDWESEKFQGEVTTSYEGVIPNVERRYKESQSEHVRREIEGYMRAKECHSCFGKRLKKEVLSVTVGGYAIDRITAMNIDHALAFFKKLALTEGKELMSRKDMLIAKPILKEIIERLGFLQNVGLSYLTLARSAATLSGGESQRIRLATQIGSSLVGVIYILDEPSIGLHQRDNAKLLKTLMRLRDIGNTVIVVEHDEDTIRSTDYVIDIGPGAGALGGEVVFAGTPKQLEKADASLTGQYLSGKLSVKVPEKYRKGNGKQIVIQGASEHNLKNLDVTIPLGKFVAITGVSGSGKSTLMTDILAKALAKHFYKSRDISGKHKAILGLEHLDKVITIDQSPIGRTPRSNPATYTGVFTHIRDIFAKTPEARIRGYKSGRFSFNVKGGRCEACQGDGVVKIEMNFLPDVYVQCEECKGKRYNEQALEIHYKNKTISDVLSLTVSDALAFFKNITAIHNKLATLDAVGLSYIALGQPATTLSGGEAQRVKLALELSKRSTGKTLYILDEPTVGLHFDDVHKLLNVLHALVDKGNTVLIIEHNLDVIKSVDYIIDLGPEGGDKGGEIVAVGTPREVAKNKKSYTGQYLAKAMGG